MTLSTYAKETTRRPGHPCAVIREGYRRNNEYDPQVVAACLACPLATCWDDMTQAEQGAYWAEQYATDALALAAKVGVRRAAVALGISSRTIQRARARERRKEEASRCTH